MRSATYEVHGNPSETARYAVTDVFQRFPEAQFSRGSKSMLAVLITCESNHIRYCLGGSEPTQGAAGLGHILYVGQSIRLTNSYAIRSLRYINHTNGSDAFLQVTFEFEIGA